MRYFTLTISALLFSIVSNSQIHGTVIFSFASQDTIVMIADCRSQIGKILPNGETSDSLAVAYVDSLPKMFILKKFLISTAGTANIGEKMLSRIVTDFNQWFPEGYDFKTTIVAFQSYLDSLFPLVKYPISENQAFIAAGFIRDSPLIIAFDRKKRKITDSLFQTAGVVCNIGDLLDYLGRYKGRYAGISNAIPDIVQQAVRDYDNDTHHNYAVGTLFTVAVITRGNNIIWKQNDFRLRRQENTITDLINSIIAGRIYLYPVIPNGKDAAISILKTNRYYLPEVK